MNTQTTDLILFHGRGETLADRMRAAVQAEGLEALVKDAKTHVRTALADAVTDESERTGTQFTAKLDGWSAQWTDPDPKPQVSDREAFAEWAWKNAPYDVPELDVLVVHDEQRAAMALTWLGNSITEGDPPEMVRDKVDALFEVLEPGYEYALPADPFAPLIDSGRCKIIGNPDDGYQLVDTDTGETVPGVKVTRQKPTLRLVPKGKAQRQAAKRDVAEVLGIDQAALGGDA